MRVLLTTWGSRGDIEPVTALAVRLRELGAEALVCAPPEAEFTALLDRFGVEHVPLGPSVKDIVTSEKPDAFRLAGQLVTARFDALGAAAVGCDAIVATGLFPAGARSVADKLGIRYVLAGFHVMGMPSDNFGPSQRPGQLLPKGEPDLGKLWDIDAQNLNVLYGEAENRHRAEIGLPPVDDIRSYVFTERPWLAADLVLAPWKDLTKLELTQTGAWILPDDRPLDSDLAEFLAAGEPPVYVGFGSAAMHVSKDVARVAIEAVRASGHRVLVSRGWAGFGLIDDTDDCFAVGEANHQELFRCVAAVVHHGGAGTTTTAARAGAPQVIVPQFADQPWWAKRVAELGIGAAHDGPTPTVESLSAALGTALTPETRARATTVATTIRTDGTTVAANLLLDGQ